VDVAAIPEVMTRNPPAAPEAIAAASRLLPAELPEDYAALLAQADGLLANHFALYSCSDLPERNATFEVGKYAPGFVIVGGDGGGSAIVMRGGPGRSPVFLVGHGVMQSEFMERLAHSLAEWIDLGCPVDPDAEQMSCT
jgi:SMI1 / KNR4 family (SUKH-1)